jgi:hypothetical protein
MRVVPPLASVALKFPDHATAPSTAIFVKTFHVFAAVSSHGALVTTGPPEPVALQRYTDPIAAVVVEYF